MSECNELNISRLVSYIDERSNKLDAEYDRHDGDKQMQSIISGQLLEIAGLKQAIQRGFFSFK